MAIRPRLYGLDDDVLDQVYRSGTDAASAELAPSDMEFTLEETEQPPSSMDFTLEETEGGLAGVDRPALGTIDPWGPEPSAPTTPQPRQVSIPRGVPAGFSQAGTFLGRIGRQPMRMSGSQLAPIPERPFPQDEADEPDPMRNAPLAVIGDGARPETARGRMPASSTALLGLDVAEPEPEADGLDGIDRPASTAKSAYSPYALTDKERDRMSRAQRSDRNLGIATEIFRGLGSLAQLGTAAAGNTAAATGIGQGMSGLQPWDNRVSARVGEDIERGRAERVQAYEQQRAEEERAAAAALQAEDRAMRQQQAASRMAVDEARIQQMQADMSRQINDAAANGASADALRGLIRANVLGLPRNHPFGMRWMDVIQSPEFAAADVDTLRAIDHRIGSLMSTHAFQEGRGISAVGGGGPYLGAVPGLAVPTGGGGGGPRRVQTIGDLMAAGGAPAPVPGAPMPAPMPEAPRGGGGARRPVAAPAPVAAPPAPAGPNALPDLSQYGIEATNQAEYVSALAALERGGRRFSDEEIRTNPRLQLALATNIMAMRERNAGRRADLQRSAEDIMRNAAGENISPDEQPLYTAVSTRANQVHNDLVVKFAAPLRALEHAIRVRDQHPRGSADYVRLDAMIRAALGGNGRVRSLAPLATLGNAVARMREDFGRGQSGAAISDSEWAGFDNIMNVGSFLTDPDVTMRSIRAMYDRAVNIRDSRFSEGTRPEQATRFADNWRATRSALNAARTARGGR